MKQFIVFSLEPLLTRYTYQWHTHLPKIFREKLGNEYEVIQLNGKTKSDGVTPGAFLDFEATNIWKCEQTELFFFLMKCGLISDDAIILFTDAWNPCVHQLKYTKELLKKNWTLIGIFHAGSYDPGDFLGRINDKNWAFNLEQALYDAYDINWFATKYHELLFHLAGHKKYEESKYKSVVAGFPMEYIKDIEFPNIPKENVVVFPARMAPEKQPELVKAIAKLLPEYEFVFCCEENMNKEEYHRTLARSKVMISVSLQETLGITQAEGMAAKCLSLVPNRLSYTEMYKNTYNFLYPSAWSLENKNNIQSLANLIKLYVENYDFYLPELQKVFEFQMKNFFSCDKMIEIIKNI